MGPSSSIGAAMPDSRRPAVKVVVFQWPCGNGRPGIARRMAHGRVSGPSSWTPRFLVDEDQSLGIEVELTVEPGYAGGADIGGAAALRRAADFFLNVMPRRSREQPHRTRAQPPHASLNGKALPDLGKGDIRRLLDEGRE